jgi:hypothetical protein
MAQIIHVNFTEINDNEHFTTVSVHVLVVLLVVRNRSTHREPPSCQSTRREPPSCQSTRREPPSRQMILSDYITLTIFFIELTILEMGDA